MTRRPGTPASEQTPIRVTEADTASGLVPRIELEGPGRAQVLIRDQGYPVGVTRIAYEGARLDAAGIRAAVVSDPALESALARRVLRRWLLRSTPSEDRPAPSFSAIVCTRDRAAQLGPCLDAIVGAASGHGEIIVVDNAPSDDSTHRLAGGYPVRYLREPRPGLNWARAAGARAARGDVILFTDDDCVVDRGWITALLAPFAASRVAAVTGLTLPLELETPAQELFERLGGHGRGFEPQSFDRTVLPPAAAGRVGSGANMAFRRELAVGLDLFGSELDAGTRARSGGDAYAFYQLLRAGHRIAYTPEALVWHRHRRQHAELRRMLRGYSVGVYAFLTRCLLLHRDLQALEVGLQWFSRYHLRQLLRALRGHPDAPLDVTLAEWLGAIEGPWAYWRTRRRERRLATGATAPAMAAVPDRPSRQERNEPLEPEPSATQAPRASVVIPSHDRCRSLERVLEALSTQTVDRSAFEVIVVLDGCRDGSARMLADRGWQERLPRLGWIEVPHGGQAAARNAGAERAAGAVLIFLDDDVVPDADLVAAHLDRHRGGERIAVLGPAPVRLPERPTFYDLDVWAWWEDRYRERAQAMHGLAYRDFCAGNVSLRRVDFRAAGGFDPAFRGYGGEDFDLGHRLLAMGVRFVLEPRASAAHWHRGNPQELLRRVRQEGRQDVLLGRKHPELRRGLRLMNRARAARSIFRFPRAWAAGAAAGRLLLGPLALFQLYKPWRWLFGKLRHHGYWCGVRDALGSLDALSAFWAEAPPIPESELDLTAGLPAQLAGPFDRPCRLRVTAHGRTLGFLRLDDAITGPIPVALAEALMAQLEPALRLAFLASDSDPPLIAGDSR